MPTLTSDNRIVAPSLAAESDSNHSTELIERIGRRLIAIHPSRSGTIALSVLLTIGATYGDAVTSAATTFTLFYVLSLAIGTWFAGVWAGYVIVVLAVAGSAFASVVTPPYAPSWWFLAWNGVVDVILYVGCVQVVGALRRRLEREVAAREDALGQLRHAERLTTIGKLAAGIAHEIGTPLNVISGRAELIASGTLDPPAIKASAAIVIEQSERVGSIIRQLLDFARRGGTRVTRTDVSDLVETTALLLGSIAKKTGVEIVRLGSHVEANLNRAEMQQVLTNLITNSIHAMPKGGQIEIETRLEHTRPPGLVSRLRRAYAVIQVRDHGSGIALEVLPKVFDPFFTTKDLGQGTGLGLSVAYGIVRDHHGWLTIDTKIGGGTTVTVYVPQ